MADPIIPLGHYTEEDGTIIWFLKADDFDRVNAGYGCPECLATWDFYVPKCPHCGFNNQPDVKEHEFVQQLVAPS